MSTLQSQIDTLIQQRDRTWQTHDQAVAHSQQLNRKYHDIYHASTPAVTIPALTHQQFPHDEVVAVIQELGQLDQAIATQKAKIQVNIQQIKQYQRNTRNLIIGIATIAIVSVGIVILQSQNQSKSSEHSPSSSIHSLT